MQDREIIDKLIIPAPTYYQYQQKWFLVNPLEWLLAKSNPYALFFHTLEKIKRYFRQSKRLDF